MTVELKVDSLVYLEHITIVSSFRGAAG
jgi:hypothetical protein